MMARTLEVPTPGLAHAFNMGVERGAPVMVGMIATGGERSYIPVIGGTFDGEGLSGRLTGGGEMMLTRADGVTVVEASYYIMFADGAVTRAFGTGYQTSGGAFSGMRISLLFEAAEDSSVVALATRAFIAEQADDSAIMTIDRII